jgi:hypothetical protein
MAAVRLEGTLRHFTPLLLNLSLALQQSLSIPELPMNSHLQLPTTVAHVVCLQKKCGSKRITARGNHTGPGPLKILGDFSPERTQPFKPIHRPPDICKEKALSAPQTMPVLGAENSAPEQQISFFTRNGATRFLSADSLKIVLFSVLLSNPLTKDDFSSTLHRFRFTLLCLFATGGQNQREDL